MHTNKANLPQAKTPERIHIIYIHSLDYQGKQENVYNIYKKKI